MKETDTPFNPNRKHFAAAPFSKKATPDRNSKSFNSHYKGAHDLLTLPVVSTNELFVNTPSNITGDLGEFIIEELARRGVMLPKPSDLPRLPSTWLAYRLDFDAGPAGLALGVQSCSLESISGFLLTLLSPLRVERPYSKDHEMQFWFKLDGKDGTFRGTEEGCMTSFLGHGVTLIIAKHGHEICLGFS